MRTRRSHWQIAIAAPAAIITIATSTTHTSARAAEPPQLFVENSPFRTLIPADAEVDPTGAAMIGAVARDDSANVSTIAFGIPIYTADARTPRYSVPCIITESGRCPFDALQVPIPDGARPQDGSDGAMVVMDRDNRKLYEFWRAKQVNGSWATEFADVNSLDGSGWAGIQWDYDGMTNIPWKRLRLLK